MKSKINVSWKHVSNKNMSITVKHIFTILASILFVLSISSCQYNSGPDSWSEPTAPLPKYSGSAPDAQTLLDSIPAYSGIPYTEVNKNIPFFTEEDFVVESFENYSSLDPLGRCGAAFANIGRELMPTEEIGSIGHIRPSGWHTVKYDVVEGNYLYNRCHLIGYQLTGETANEKNLITGTRYMNVTGMLPFENMTADYIKETGFHVLYRVTPLFRNDHLLAEGVLMEACSVEDMGEGICFCVFVYNIQPGINIDYATGESSLETAASPDSKTPDSKAPDPDSSESGFPSNPPENASYILNTNTMKFHLPSCSSAEDIAEKNKELRQGRRQDIIDMGYAPCKRCRP